MKTELQVAIMNEAYHRKQMEYYQIAIKVLEEKKTPPQFARKKRSKK